MEKKCYLRNIACLQALNLPIEFHKVIFIHKIILYILIVLLYTPVESCGNTVIKIIWKLFSSYGTRNYFLLMLAKSCNGLTMFTQLVCNRDMSGENVKSL